MEERKFIKLKKEEFGIKEYIKRDLGKGKISKLDIEYTPVGEKIIISTCKPGLVIGRKGEKIGELTDVLKKRFKLDNPHIEIKEIENPLFDAQTVADEIALSLERMGNLKFKVIAYKKLQEIIKAGALGCELRLSGKLPSERAKSWRFAEGYLKKAGDSSKEVDRAQAVALTKTGIIGVKAAIMPPYARIYDRIEINDEMRAMVKKPIEGVEDKKDEKKKFGESISSSERDFSDEKRSDKNISSLTRISNQLSNKDNSLVQNARQDKARSEDKLNEKKVEVSKKQSSRDKKLKDTNAKHKGEETIKEIIETEIKPEEDGTAMKIEEEIEEGVPQGIIDEEMKEAEKEHEEKIEAGKSEKEKLSERMVEQARNSSPDVLSLEDTNKDYKSKNRKDIKGKNVSGEEE